jgi:hypothetical protein
MEFSEVVDEDGDVNSFYQMNLSRPLMKAIGLLGFTHPTPIQSMTIPVALLGRDIFVDVLRLEWERLLLTCFRRSKDCSISHLLTLQ